MYANKFEGVYSWNKIRSSKSLVMLECESGTSLHAVQYKWQTGSVLILGPYHVRDG